MAKRLKRRAFLERLGLGCAQVGATTLLSGITTMGVINSAAAANVRHSFFTPPNNDYKALVCIMLGGGADSFNMLIPNDDYYSEYAEARGTLTIAQENILNLGNVTADGRSFGLHPSLKNTKRIFDEGDLTFIANVGSLTQRVTKDNLNGRTTPNGLYSHADQSSHWQSALYRQIKPESGWGGRIADVLSYQNTNETFSMNLSLNGVNQFQSGNTISPYTITNFGGGAVQLNNIDSDSVYETLKRQTLDSMYEQEYSNILSQAFTRKYKSATGSSGVFANAINNVPEFNATYSVNSFSQNLQMIAKTIAARTVLDFRRQVFFLNLGGWDSHANALSRDNTRLTTLDEGLGSFYDTLKELGLQDKVTTYTISDFGRKLATNRDGSDHGWGGNTIVMGGAVNGGSIYGEYPELHEDGTYNVGGGRFIPTLSCDEYFAELALWFGVSTTDLDYVFPYLKEFWTPSSGNPIGFLS